MNTKYIILLLSVFAFLSCGKEELSVDQSALELRGAQKVDVCHYDSETNTWKVINVNVNAVKAHRGHGDAVDMDGDGYFDIPSECGPTDCNDGDASVTCNKWSGTSHPYLIGVELSCDYQTGTVNWAFPGGTCTGALTLLNNLGTKYVYHQNISGPCVQNCHIIIVLNADGSIRFKEDCTVVGFPSIIKAICNPTCE